MNNFSWNSTTTAKNETLEIVQIPDFLDYACRVLCLVVHAAYFVIVLSCKDLRKISLIHMHHTNLIGLLTAIHYCIWIAWTEPSTGNEQLNDILCSISEAFWALSKFARCYSILNLALYRMVAVFRVTLFKKIVKSIKIYAVSTIMVWVVSGVIFVIAKFSSHTLPGLIICYDGYSPNSEDSIQYYIITSILGFLLPFILVKICYIAIRMKLDSLDTKLHQGANHHQEDFSKNDLHLHQNHHQNDTNNSTASQQTNNNATTTLSLQKKHKERGLAKQFVVINIIEMLSCVFFVLLSSSNVITIFNTQYYFARQLFRIGNLICQTLIPFASLIYNPIFKKSIVYMKSLF